MTPLAAAGEKLFGPEGLSTPLEIIAVLSALRESGANPMAKSLICAAATRRRSR